mgnify:CR=1 FL=1
MGYVILEAITTLMLFVCVMWFVTKILSFYRKDNQINNKQDNNKKEDSNEKVQG